MRERKNHFNLEDYYREQGDRMEMYKPKPPNRWLTKENILAVVLLIVIFATSIVY